MRAVFEALQALQAQQAQLEGDPVLEIVRGIYKDLTGRGGLDLDNVDDEIKAEMVTKWYGIVNRHFKLTTTLGPMDILRACEAPR